MKTRWIVLLFGVAAACGGTESSAPKVNSAAQVVALSGSSQAAQAGQPLPVPLVVQVTDASKQPVSHVVVSFTIKSGGGQLSKVVDTTDASGQSTVTWTVGTTVGIGTVEA